jgi:hypothetical protein
MADGGSRSVPEEIFMKSLSVNSNRNNTKSYDYFHNMNPKLSSLSGFSEPHRRELFLLIFGHFPLTIYRSQF